MNNRELGSELAKLFQIDPSTFEDQILEYVGRVAKRRVFREAEALVPSDEPWELSKRDGDVFLKHAEFGLVNLGPFEEVGQAMAEFLAREDFGE